MESHEAHNKIIEVLNQGGPGLPVQIAKDMGMSSLFISAFLSELVNENRIKMSNLKVGGTPLYFLEGQEEQLEKFSKHLHPREQEAFLKLKKNKVLKDLEQNPAIRVALRSIRDFAIGFKKQGEIYWRYMLVPISEANSLLSKKPQKQPQKQEKAKKENKTQSKTPSTKEHLKTNIKTTPNNEFYNPLAKEEKEKKKPKSEFNNKVINFLQNNEFIIIQEKDYKKREYNCISQFPSKLGPTNFLTQAKDKKSVSETDMKKLLSNAQAIPLPALMLYTGKLSKKAKEYIDKYFSILKTQKIE